MGNSPYRPPQWNEGASPSTVILVFPGQQTTAQYNQEGITATLPTNQTTYVFDAVLRAGHEQRLRKTMHPVQTGAAISDHAYIEPARVSLDIGMSDVMDQFQPGMWTGAQTKSVSAFQTMLALQFSRIPLTLLTKLRIYHNLVIESITDEETAKTITGLRMRVEFGEIFSAQTQAVPDSARSQDTQQTNLGTVNSTPPTTVQTNQNQVGTGVEIYPAHTIGAGNWSSVSTTNLPLLPVPSH
jgi:hypothetical protein